MNASLHSTSEGMNNVLQLKFKERVKQTMRKFNFICLICGIAPIKFHETRNKIIQHAFCCCEGTYCRPHYFPPDCHTDTLYFVESLCLVLKQLVLYYERINKDFTTLWEKKVFYEERYTLHSRPTSEQIELTKIEKMRRAKKDIEELFGAYKIKVFEHLSPLHKEMIPLFLPYMLDSGTEQEKLMEMCDFIEKSNNTNNY